MEPSLNPPIDEKLERIGDYVDSLTIEDLVIEIHAYGLDEKVKEAILEIEVPNANDFMQEVVRNGNLDFLLKLVSTKTIFDIREMLIDFLYWKDQSWAS